MGLFISALQALLSTNDRMLSTYMLTGKKCSGDEEKGVREMMKGKVVGYMVLVSKL